MVTSCPAIYGNISHTTVATSRLASPSTMSPLTTVTTSAIVSPSTTPLTTVTTSAMASPATTPVTTPMQLYSNPAYAHQRKMATNRNPNPATYYNQDVENFLSPANEFSALHLRQTLATQLQSPINNPRPSSERPGDDNVEDTIGTEYDHQSVALSTSKQSTLTYDYV